MWLYSKKTYYENRKLRIWRLPVTLTADSVCWAERQEAAKLAVLRLQPAS